MCIRDRYDLLQPHVQHIVVCNPRRNALLKEGSKSDKVDAQKLANLLRTGMLRPVYHGENGPVSYTHLPCGSGLGFDGSLLDRDGRRPVWHSDGEAS